MLADYKDNVTEEVFEMYFKKNSDATETIINPETGNQATRLMSSGSFKLVGAGFHCNDYPSML